MSMNECDIMGDGTKLTDAAERWKRKKKGEKKRDRKSLSDRGNQNMIPSGDGNTENMNVKRWKQREQSRRAKCVCVCARVATA